MTEATFFLSTRKASPSLREFKGHNLPGEHRQCAGPWRKESGGRGGLIIHTLSKHPIRAKPVLRALGDQKTYQPVSLRPLRTLYATASHSGRAFCWTGYFSGV